jgi:hypothetical protein
MMPHPHTINMILLTDQLFNSNHQTIKSSDNSKGGGNANAECPKTKHDNLSNGKSKEI